MENNENNGVSTQNTQTLEKDYKQEYEKQLLEIEKLRNAISKTNSENAEYKKKELAKMSDDEKKAKELQDLIDSNNTMKTELAQMKLEKECLANGFTAEESEKLIKGNFAVKDIAEIIKSKVDEAVKSTKAEMTKGSTSNGLLGKGTAEKGNEQSDFQKRQESRQKQTNIVEL